MKLLNGDCLELLKDIPDKTIDLIVTDPPYKFESKGGGAYGSTTRKYRSELKQINCCEFEPKMFLEIIQNKTKAFYGYFFCNKTLVDVYIRFAKDNGYQYDIFVLAKQNPIPAYSNHHLCDMEYIVMIRDKCTYFSMREDFNDYRKFYLTNCRKGIHPAEKPVELIQRFIKVSSKIGDVVLDPFMGSGTTGIACAKLKREFIGIEINQDIFQIAQRRINAELEKQVLPLE